MTFGFRMFLLGVVIVLIDLYFYQAILALTKKNSAKNRKKIFYIYWGFTVLSILILLSPFVFNTANWPRVIKVYVFAIVILVLFSKIIGSLLIALDDILRLFRWIGSLFTKKPSEPSTSKNRITRLQFLNYMALGMTAIPLIGLIRGMIKGAFDFKIHNIKVVLPNLPDSFNGLRIVQISDIHIGSFLSTSPLEKAIEIILQQKADIIFITGDLVNDRTAEINPFMDTLSKIKAPMGVFSIMGNHDYGDYAKWDSQGEKDKNLQDIIEANAQLGWKLLMNENVILEKNNSEIVLIGVENWGGNLHFPKYGNMEKAYRGAEKYPVKLLLSHDPSHWNMEIIEKYKDIDLTFSGHTHGFQFGIEVPGLKWSPSQYIYKQWAGLYSEGKQQIYVNRGLGFLGYPGRIGILPEITVMELHNA